MFAIASQTAIPKMVNFSEKTSKFDFLKPVKLIKQSHLYHTIMP